MTRRDLSNSMTPRTHPLSKVGSRQHEENELTTQFSLVFRHNPNFRICLDKSYDARTHPSVVERLTERHLMYKGIHLGDVEQLLWARTMEGRRINSGSRGELLVETQWSRSEQPFTLATTLHNASEEVRETFTLERGLPRTFLDIFSQGDLVVFVGGEHFGTVGKVEGVDKQRKAIMVEVETSGTLEENLGHSLGRGLLKSRDYYSSAEIASRLQIPGFAVAKLTGTVYLSPPIGKGSPTKGKGRKKKGENFSPEEEKSWKENIGLNLKFNKRNLEVRGYSRKSDNQWVYSLKAVEVLEGNFFNATSISPNCQLQKYYL